MEILVSVIIPCYNQSHFLNDAFQSVLAQTCVNWECIIVNDGSTDATEEVATSLCKQDHRLQYLSKENGGVSSARNAGIAKASGKYILALDADDKIHPSYLANALEAFEKDKQLFVVYAEAEYFGGRTGQWALPKYSYKALLLNNLIYCSAIFRKSDFEKAGGYDEQLKDGWEDWELWIRLLYNAKKVFKLPQVGFYYRQKEGSMLHLLIRNDEKWEKTEKYIFKKHHQIYQEYFGGMIANLRKIKKLETELTNIKVSMGYKVSTRIITLFGPFINVIKR